MDAQALAFYMQNHPWRELPRAKPTDATYIVTGPVRIRWCALATPKDPQKRGKGVSPTPQVPADGKAPRLIYDATLLIPGASDITVLRSAYVRLMSERFGPNFQQTLVKNVPMPDGSTVVASAITGGVKQQAEMFNKMQDGKPAPVEGFEQTGWFLSSSNAKQPPIAGVIKDPITGKIRELDPASKEVYAGMWVLANLRMYTRPKPGAPLDNPGISFQLEGLQKIADDTQFVSRNALQAFGEVATFGGVTNGTGAPAQTPTLPAGF